MAIAASRGLMLKNTFLHVDGGDAMDDFDLDTIKRQTSEPAPMKKQLSCGYGAPRENVFRSTLAPIHSNGPSMDVLPMFNPDDSEDEEDIMGPPELDDEFVTMGFCPKRQSTDFSDPPAEMDRQISSLSLNGDRQISSLSTGGGLCRQVTEQEWPCYQFPASKELQQTTRPEEAASSTDRYFPSELEGDLNNSCEASQKTDANPYAAFQNLNPAALAYAMQTMNMQWPVMAMAGQDMYSGMAANAKPPVHKNRRKARSLVTLAQEAQKQKQQELAQQQMMLQFQNQMMLQAQVQAMAGGLSSIGKSGQQTAGDEAQTEVPKMQNLMMGMQDFVPAKQAATKPAMMQETSGPEERKFCPHCGAKIKQHFKFCQFCGGDLPA